MARKETDFVVFSLRLRESLRNQIEAAAKANDHSLNREILRRLENSFVSDEIGEGVTKLVLDKVSVFLDGAFVGVKRERPNAPHPKRRSTGAKK